MRKQINAPYKNGLILWVTFCVSTLGIFAYKTTLPIEILMVVALNTGTFLLYGADKLAAAQGWRRVPEYVLYFAAFAGGALGALLGMYLFRHKTSKQSFQFGLAIILLIEILIVAYILNPI